MPGGISSPFLCYRPAFISGFKIIRRGERKKGNGDFNARVPSERGETYTRESDGVELVCWWAPLVSHTHSTDKITLRENETDDRCLILASDVANSYILFPLIVYVSVLDMCSCFSPIGKKKKMGKVVSPIYDPSSY
ncbi:hypothetical protein OUZ56_007927 [Daphnia magna]|uniref:Uncharacterized protein n=1 Tax=Daphnia magna TaxID=35525 RepID=A0ABR0ABR2_9CRUS|nr:hypothetical protein OUZ56_007927 [Daphnia magna]